MRIENANVLYPWFQIMIMNEEILTKQIIRASWSTEVLTQNNLRHLGPNPPETLLRPYLRGSMKKTAYFCSHQNPKNQNSGSLGRFWYNLRLDPKSQIFDFFGLGLQMNTTFL